MALHPLPPVYTQDPLLFMVLMGINRKTDIRACHLPWGVPYRWPIFKFRPPGCSLVCKSIKIVNHDIFRLLLQIILPRNKSRGNTPSARQILTPTPFRRHWRVGIWAHALSATVACTLGSSSARIVVTRDDGVDINDNLVDNRSRTHGVTSTYHTDGGTAPQKTPHQRPSWCVTDRCATAQQNCCQSPMYGNGLEDNVDS